MLICRHSGYNRLACITPCRDEASSSQAAQIRQVAPLGLRSVSYPLACCRQSRLGLAKSGAICLFDKRARRIRAVAIECVTFYDFVREHDAQFLIGRLQPVEQTPEFPSHKDRKSVA